MTEFCDEWEGLGEDTLMSTLLAWVDNIQLTEHEVESITKSILENSTGYSKGWLELMLTRIDRTIARSQCRLDQSLALRLQVQTDRIVRRLTTRLDI